MIVQLQKTFEYFPKCEGEEERCLTAIEHVMGYQYRLSIDINGRRHTTSYSVSEAQMQMIRSGSFDEDVILRSLCGKFSDKFIGPTE